MAKQRRGQQPRARCWFCGAGGVTQEHILARQLTKLFLPPHGVTADPSERPPFRHEYVHPTNPEANRTKHANWLAERSRKFCKSCNGGWMKDIDHAALPLLEAFAVNRRVALDAEQQQQLALWVTKVLFAFQAKEPEDLRCVDRSLFHELFETRAPLAGSQVWLGRNSHGDIAFANAHTLLFETNFPDQDRGFGASLSFGYANFHVMYHGSDEMLLRLREPLTRAFKQIWPAGADVTWPSYYYISAKDISFLAEQFNLAGEFVPSAAMNNDNETA